MKLSHLFCSLLLATSLFAQPNTLTPAQKADGWQLLFDGKSLDGWRANEKPGTFKVEDGCIVVHGPRSHLFYAGPVQNHDFKNFELRLEAKTFPKANSGVYIHTEFNESGWPPKGYEVQVNTSHSDWRRTAGLYAIQDVREAASRDGEWFTLRIRVDGRRITTWVNDRQIADYVEEQNPVRPDDMKGRLLSRGTIALQGHDPESRVLFRSIAVRPLP
jgi:Domain of Unknown Function (DUF1080).